MSVTVDQFVTVNDGSARRAGDFKRKGVDGAPYVSDPAGTTVKSGQRKGEVRWVMYSRPSGYGKQIESTWNLQKWSERQIALGFGTDLDLSNRAALLAGRDQSEEGWRAEADAVARLALEAAKAGLAAERGSHTHALAEDFDTERDWVARAETGEDLGIPRDAADVLVRCWEVMLAVNGIEVLATEAPVVNDVYRVAGTLDRIVRLGRDLHFVLPSGESVTLPAGTVLVLDVKTGKRRADDRGVIAFWHGYSIQVWLYASAVPYDVTSETRGVWPWPVDQRWALIAHLDVLGALEGAPSCTLVLVDLAAGKLGADLCRAAKEFEALDDIFSVAQLVDTIDDCPVEDEVVQIDDRRAGLRARCRVVAELDPNAGRNMAAFWPDNMPLLTADRTITDDELDVIEAHVERFETMVSAPFPEPVEPASTLRPYPTELEPVPELPNRTPDEGPVLDAADPLVVAMKASYGRLDAVGAAIMSETIGEALRAHRPIHMGTGMTTRRVLTVFGLLSLIHADCLTAARDLVAQATGVDACLFPTVPLGAVVSVMSWREAETFALAAADVAAGRMGVDVGSARLVKISQP